MKLLEPGDTLDHYRIDATVARSGMGTLYRATDLNFDRQVAVKVPHPEMEADPILLERFKREQEIGQLLDHPGAVKITLAICDALDYMHKRGIVHRDLKPENVMVAADDSIKLIDFGIAMKEDARRLTHVNMSSMLGTPDYISPEQVKGQRGDQRSDIYALGIMFYEMLTGRVPFVGANPLAAMNERVLHDPKPPRELNPEISPQ